MRNVSDRLCRESENGLLCSIIFFSLENRAFYGVMWRNIVERGRPQRTMWRMRIAYWISKGTNTLSEYLILIAFLLQPWFHERAVTLRNAYIAYVASFVTSLKLNLCTQNSEENNGIV
jgi:hypothetical protein